MQSIMYLVDGFKLIWKPGLKRFVAIPLLLNMVLFISLFFLLRHFMAEFNAWFYHFLPTWLHWLTFILWLLFFLSFVLLFSYTFVTLANLIAAPFNSFLSEKVEFYLTGKRVEEKSFLQTLREAPRMIGRQFAILGYYLPRAALILLLLFVPVVHLFVPLLWFLFNAWFLALTYVDYPTDNHQISIPQLRQWLKDKRGPALIFGLSVLVVTMIPILNFFAMPAAVAGATKFWVEEGGVST